MRPPTSSLLIRDTANHNLLGSSSNPINPLLATLGNYGETQTLALLPGSPAIDAGGSAYGGRIDQRSDHADA